MTLRSLARSLTVAASFVAALAAQQTATYTFSNTVGSFTPITGGSVLITGAFDDSFFNNVPVGFDFPFGGTAAGSGWTNVIGVSTNGWLKCSNIAGSSTTYSAISSTVQLRVVSPFGRDLQNASATSEVRVETLGIAPNRVCVVQWSDVRPFGTLSTSNNMSLSFQSRLYETTGVIENVYGTCVLNSPTATTPTTTAQVGIKGNASADFKNCASTSSTFSWASPNLAGTSSSSHFVGPHVVPAPGAHVPDFGRTYAYTPAAFPPAALVVTAVATDPLYYVTGMPIITASATTAPANAVISNLAMTINLSSIGGNAAQPMLDDGVFPDAAIDGTFTYQPTLYSAVPIAYSFPITATATGANNGTAAAAVSIYTLVNDVPMGSILVTRGVNGPFSNVNAVAGNQPGFNTPCGVGGNIGGKDVFFVYTPTCTGTASFSTCGGDNINQPGELSDSQLVIYDSSLALLGCNDDFEPIAALCGANGYQSRVNNIAVTAGALYLIRVCGYSSASGTFNLTIDESSAVSTQFGVSCGDYPLVLNGTLPILGSLGTLSIVNGRPGSAGILAYSIPTNTVSQLGACAFYLDIPSAAVFVTFIPDAFGMWSITAPLPNDPNIACLTASMQAFTFASGGMDASNGLSLTFGY